MVRDSGLVEALAGEMGVNCVRPGIVFPKLGVRDWGDTNIVPVGLTPELLNSPCPVFGGRHLIKDTHVLFWVPSRIDGEDFTLMGLSRRCFSHTASLGKIFYSNPEEAWYKDIAFANTPFREGGYVLMPRGYVPNTNGKTYTDQEPIVAPLKQAYETAGCLALSTGIITRFLLDGVRLYEYSYGFCSDTFTGSDNVLRRVYSGDFASSGLGVYGYAAGGCCRTNIGRAVLRKFS